MRTKVLVPYKITLLSNTMDDEYTLEEVLVPYKITLLSNDVRIVGTSNAF